MITDYIKIIDLELKDYIEKNIESSIQDIIFYTIKNGKRLRPMISLDIYKTLNKQINKQIIEFSLLVELLHNASLIIDDLPYMDNDNLRRGQPTLHKKYSIKLSNIISNYLISFVINKIINISHDLTIQKNLINLLCDQTMLASIGQYYDIYKTNIDYKELSFKTSPFFTLFFVGGYILGGGTSSNISKLIELSCSFSILFQISDDFEDLDKDKDKYGNYIHKYGYEKTIDIYNCELVKFNNLLNLLEINSGLFKEILTLLNNKVPKNGF